MVSMIILDTSILAVTSSICEHLRPCPVTSLICSIINFISFDDDDVVVPFFLLYTVKK